MIFGIGWIVRTWRTRLPIIRELPATSYSPVGSRLLKPRLALKARGMALEEIFRTLRSDGSVSFQVFRIEEAE